MNGYRYDIGAIQFDVIIVRAGINGSAIARDAAMRGLQVLLVDKGDISAGTTSWSTRLIHGGLRYLEHFEVPLVRESLHERGTLLWTAPHLVRPLHFLIPLSAEGSRRAGLIRLGMVACEVLSERGGVLRTAPVEPWPAEGSRWAASSYFLVFRSALTIDGSAL